MRRRHPRLAGRDHHRQAGPRNPDRTRLARKLVARSPHVLGGTGLALTEPALAVPTLTGRRRAAGRHQAPRPAGTHPPDRAVAPGAVARARAPAGQRPSGSRSARARPRRSGSCPSSARARLAHRAGGYRCCAHRTQSAMRAPGSGRVQAPASYAALTAAAHDIKHPFALDMQLACQFLCSVFPGVTVLSQPGQGSSTCYT